MNLELRNTRRNNKIYTDGTAVYKIFNEGYPKNDVFLEAYITAKVEDLGITVPSIQEISFKNNKWMFKSTNITGKNIYELLKEFPEKSNDYLEKLVDIQTSIHKYRCPELPIQKQKFSDYIDQSNLEESMKIDLKDMLNSSPKHRKLCHGNFTPHNVILSEDKAYIVDWNHAVQGNASADVSRTYLWFQGRMPEYAEQYLNIFCEKTNTSSRYVHNWIPIVAAARLAKNIPEEQELLRSVISVIEY